MSRYTYAGKFVNPTEGWYVKEAKDGLFEIWVRSDRNADGSADPDHRHTSAPRFEDDGEAAEYISDMRDVAEQDYDDYLEENHDDIVRQERYEDWRNER